MTTGKVVDGRVVVEGEALSEGASVTVLVPDEATFDLSEEDEAARSWRRYRRLTEATCWMPTTF
jgi:hypothetical protein